MNILVLYSSDYKGNTKKIAEHLGTALGAKVLNVNEFKDFIADIETYDVIGFGSGVYKESMSTKIFDIVKSLELMDKKTFVFSTSGVGMKFYNNKLTRKIESKGGIVIGSFACKGYYKASEFTDNKIFNIMSIRTIGHPDNNDLKNADKFALEIKNNI